MCCLDSKLDVIMAISHVRILGKGHLLCLTRTLQTSLEEEQFADVRLVANSNKYLRANKAVLAAASPFFACLLKERAEDDEITIVFDGMNFFNLI